MVQAEERARAQWARRARCEGVVGVGVRKGEMSMRGKVGGVGAIFCGGGAGGGTLADGGGWAAMVGYEKMALWRWLD